MDRNSFKKSKECVKIDSDNFYNDYYDQIERLLTFGNFFGNQNRLSNYIELCKNLDDMYKKYCLQENDLFFQKNQILSNERSTYNSGIYNYYTLENKKAYFVDEYRCLILFCLKTNFDKKTSVILKKIHMYIHLIQLHMSKNMTMFEKLNVFLNTNFRLEKNDVVKNLLRGNFGIVSEENKNLQVALEAFECGTSQNTFSINDWAKKYDVNSLIFKILSNSYKEFDSIMEFCCYKAKFEQNFNIKKYIEQCELLQILIDGNFASIFKDDELPESFKLCCFLLKPSFLNYDPCKLGESFKNVFLEAYEINFYYACRFLIYSKHKNMLFNIYSAKIDFSKHLYIEDIVDLAHKNCLSYETFVMSYLKFLQEQDMHLSLFKTIIKYKICNFEFKKESIRYVIKNREKVKSLVENGFSLKCNNFMFIFYLLQSETHSHDVFEFLISHKYFYYAVDIIMDVLSNLKNKKLMIMALNKIVDAETNGIDYDMYDKKEFMQNLNL
ncbi:hypothetical protein EHP00_149 [Ecytonucleospora hepatopenaei]|uniref:Uncharacterized protein n=1 Tax=Ecytonucleospora hepatopenaei TaxID=646526 RepID=A0A1W0E5X4_9MICR|nr:hypothetical protein EHP00_149 [Ecytonucleospora hepatopenaei]